MLGGAALESDALRGAASTFGTALDGELAQAQLGAGSTVLALASLAGGELLATGHVDGSVRCGTRAPVP